MLDSMEPRLSNVACIGAIPSKNPVHMPEKKALTGCQYLISSSPATAMAIIAQPIGVVSSAIDNWPSVVMSKGIALRAKNQNVLKK